MTNDPEYPICLIDPPTGFDPLEELIGFRQEALEMLEQYPGHPQWLDELESVDEKIEWRRLNPLPNDPK